MDNARWWMVAVVVAAFVAGCEDISDEDEVVILDTDGDGIRDDIDTDTTAENTFTWSTLVFATPDAATALTGSAIARELIGADVFAAQVTLRNDIQGAVRPWHVHIGTCARGGAIVGLDADYPRLLVDLDGMARSTVRIPVRLDPAATFHVDVHESDAAFNTIIACGDLELQ